MNAARCVDCDVEGPPRGPKAVAAGWTNERNPGGSPAWRCPDHSPVKAQPAPHTHSLGTFGILSAMLAMAAPSRWRDS